MTVQKSSDVQNQPPAELFHVLYSRMSDPTAFGDGFAADERNSIIYSRLTNSFSQEIIRLLMSCVRADAERRGENVEEAIERASVTVRSALEEAKQLKGNYR